MSLSEIPKTIEAVFEDREDYLNYFNEALKLFRNPRSRKPNGVSSLVPEYIEIEFCVNTKSPRLYFPKKRPEAVIIQLPVAKNSKSPRSKGDIRKNNLPMFASIKGRIEVAITDEFAIRLKLLKTVVTQTTRSKKTV